MGRHDHDDEGGHVDGLIGIAVVDAHGDLVGASRDKGLVKACRCALASSESVCRAISRW